MQLDSVLGGLVAQSLRTTVNDSEMMTMISMESLHACMRHLAVALLLAIPGTQCAAGEVADYRFQGRLDSDLPGAPPLKARQPGIGGFTTVEVDGAPRTTWGFVPGGGLQLDVPASVVGRDYSVVMVLRLDATDAFTKLLDYRERTSDFGLYSHGGEFDLFPVGDSGRISIRPGVFHQLVLTRSQGGNVVGYVDGEAQFVVMDDLQAVAAIGPALAILTDDVISEDEEGSGHLARLRLFDHVLTPEEVRSLEPWPTLFKDSFEARQLR